jgi:Molydopterin dinucleotide binding domain/Polysulphide reductase, NrfD
VGSIQPIGTADKYPYVLMTSTVAEHWCGGSTTRNIPWLNELVPEPVLEMPVTLAQKLGVKSGDWVRVSSARGELEVKALVTPRIKALKIGDREVTVVWMPYNWGYQGLSAGPSVNHITIDASDPGAGTQETKACLVNVVRAGRPAAKIRILGETHMTNAATAGPIRATLIDITNCIGCRAWQVACKQWNEREGEETELEAELGFQNPATLSAKTYTLIAFHEMENLQKPGGVEAAFVMQRCLHCLEPARLPAFAQPRLRLRDGRDLRRPRLDVPRAGREGRTDHARDRRGHAVDHAPELARLPVPLMPNMLAPQWWSPVMPVSFLLSSIVAGTALAILIDMWIAKGWRRSLDITRLASVGQITFWALLVYLVFRLGDMAFRKQLSGAFAGRLGMAFAAEILLGGVLPLFLLARRSLRQRADVLFAAALLAVTGVIYNRMNVVLFAMTFRGGMPWRAPEGYAPSIAEWGISIGLIAATIFLFGLGARCMPILPKEQA